MFAPPDTNCNNCIFYDNADCRLNKITFYRKKNIAIEQKGNQTKLKNFICPYYRTQEWLSNQKGDVVEVIRKENRIPYFCVLLHLDEELIKRSIEKILKFTVKPKEIFIVVGPNQDLGGGLAAWIKLVLDRNDIKNTITFEFKDNGWHDIIKDYHRRDFMMLIEGFPSVNNRWAEVISNKVQDELFTFSYAENKNKTLKLIPAYVYNMFYFDYTDNFLSEITKQLDKQKCNL